MDKKAGEHQGETIFVVSNGCILNLNGLTYLLNRVGFGLTFNGNFQGASWPA
jgi:hypothetical protein